MKISFNLAEADLQRYRQVMLGVGSAARQIPEGVIIDAARSVLSEARGANPVQFLALRFASLELLIQMLEDADWNLGGEDRERVMNALAYFANPREVIADSSLRFLDAAIMVELICRDLKHELAAYQEFRKFRQKRAAAPVNEARRRVMEKKRAQLHERMHARRKQELSHPASNWRHFFSLLGI